MNVGPQLVWIFLFEDTTNLCGIFLLGLPPTMLGSTISDTSNHTRIHPRWCHQPCWVLPMNIKPGSLYNDHTIGAHHSSLVYLKLHHSFLIHPQLHHSHLVHLQLHHSSLVHSQLHHYSFVGDYIWSFLQVKCISFMVRKYLIHIHNDKFLCLKIYSTHSCNYFSQYNIHPYPVYIWQLFRCLPSLPRHY